MELLKRLETARKIAIMNGAKEQVTNIDMAERVIKACYPTKFLLDIEELYLLADIRP